MGMFWRFGFVEERAAGGGADLVEGGVDAAVCVGEPGKLIEVGGLELLELTVLEDLGGDGVGFG